MVSRPWIWQCSVQSTWCHVPEYRSVQYKLHDVTSLNIAIFSTNCTMSVPEYGNVKYKLYAVTSLDIVMWSKNYVVSRPWISQCSVQTIWCHVPGYRDIQYNFDYVYHIYRSWMKCDGKQTRRCQCEVIIVLLFFLLKDVNCENSVAWVIEKWMCT
jgi:hypothetical protein